MDYGLFYNIGSLLIGALIGWFITGIRQYLQKNQQRLVQETEQITLEQRMRTIRQALADEQNSRRQAEQQQRVIEREQHELYGRLAAAEERLTSLAHFRQECEQLNQELRALPFRYRNRAHF